MSGGSNSSQNTQNESEKPLGRRGVGVEGEIMASVCEHSVCWNIKSPSVPHAGLTEGHCFARLPTLLCKLDFSCEKNEE